MPDLKAYTLGEVIVNCDSRRVPVQARERKSGPYPYYGASGIVDSVDGYLFDGDYLLIAEDGENLRTRKTPVAFMASGRFWVNNHAHVVQGNHLADLRYLSYALALADISGYLSGSTQPKLTQAAMNRIEIQLPERMYQESVVAVLRALDDKIAVNDRILSDTLALGDACFITARMSASWRSTLAELATEKKLIFGDGYRTKRSEHGQPGLPILRVAEVMDGRIEPEFSDFVSDSFRSAMGGKVSQAGDVILTTKGTVGRVAAITAKDPSFVYSPQLCYFRVLAGSVLTSSYIYFWLRSSDFWRQAESRKSQTDMADYLSLTDIRKLTIPMIPPGPDRQSLPTLSSLLAKVSACHEESKALAGLRDTLLPKLMSGEIRVRDAEKVVEDVT